MRETESRIEKRTETYPVKGEEITVEAQVAVCEVCGTDMLDVALDDQTLTDAYAIYRSRHGLLQPQEIRAIRSMYGLGQKAFSRLLGWGEVTLARYETGSIQSAAHDQMLRLAQQPANMRQLLERSGERVTQEQRRTVEECLISLSDEHEALLVQEDSAAYAAGKDVKKLGEMMVYFAGQAQTWRTKLNKLLFYADFLHHRRHGRAISGSRYVHMQFGPVPADFYTLQASLVDQAALSEECLDAGDCTGTVFRALRPADTGVFDAQELQTLKDVASKFAHWTASDITAFSHREPAWSETSDRETIPYEYASRLQLD
ncbi:MAG: DUF4065 domain-containing protein [Clostridiales bacterium]|nr:DUF4065 domain-containing protein [Clostridiales bacterium]